jgi:hypothetical protein
MALRSSALVLAASLVVLPACNKEDGTPGPSPDGAATPAGDGVGGDGPAKRTESASAKVVGASGGLVSTKLPSGIEFRTLQEGAGPAPRLGAAVTVHLRGWLPDGRSFLDTRKDGFPKTYTLDKIHLMSGLVELIGGMRKGEKREAVIPARLAYGPGGYPGVVPPSSDLKFEVELVAIGTVAASPPSPLR